MRPCGAARGLKWPPALLASAALQSPFLVDVEPVAAAGRQAADVAGDVHRIRAHAHHLQAAADQAAGRGGEVGDAVVLLRGHRRDGRRGLLRRRRAAGGEAEHGQGGGGERDDAHGGPPRMKARLSHHATRAAVDEGATGGGADAASAACGPGPGDG
jgi:hypothetical protein